MTEPDNIMDLEVELYEEVMRCISRLMNMDPEAGTPAGNLLEGLAKAASAYEDRFFKFGDENLVCSHGINFEKCNVCWRKRSV